MKWCKLPHLNLVQLDLLLRTSGELSVTQLATDKTLVVAPAGAPVQSAYRNGAYMVILASTTFSQELLGFRGWVSQVETRLY